ncbi:rna-directed dna polymerase from mobile element jockey-like [Pitangus sulphuratus]|nr:rna-directed dna polymerase from mobile element jockey-like [Pitangus sulphuratus]
MPAKYSIKQQNANILPLVQLQKDSVTHLSSRLSKEKPKDEKPKLRVKSASQLKCMYTNAHRMSNKHEELEAIMQQERYDVVAITEMWWDDSHDWSAAMDGYKLFRRDRQGGRGGGVSL